MLAEAGGAVQCTQRAAAARRQGAVTCRNGCALICAQVERVWLLIRHLSLFALLRPRSVLWLLGIVHEVQNAVNGSVLMEIAYVDRRAGGLATQPPHFFKEDGYAQRQKNTFRIASQAQAIRDSLDAEQGVLSEANAFIFLQLLDVVSAVTCMLQTSADLGHVLPLLDALSTVQ